MHERPNTVGLGFSRRIVMLTLAVRLGWNAPVAAQAYFGLNAGPSLATMSGSFIEQSDGVEWGVEFQGRFEQRLFGNTWFRTGVGYIQKGGSKLTLSNSGTGTFGFKTVYLNVPVIVRQEFMLGNGPWAIGPYVGLTVGGGSACRLKHGDALEFPFTCADSLPGGTISGVEVGLPIGIDLWIEAPGAARFLVGVKVELGLTTGLQEAVNLGQAARQSALVPYVGFMLPLFTPDRVPQ